MPLTTSCEALYFPPEPMDNVLTLRWSNTEQFNLGAYSMILYKLKCSAPRLFHVVPRYGAIPLVDGSGNESDEARRGVNVVIGLHGYVLKAREAALQSSPSNSIPDKEMECNNINSANGNSPTPWPVASSSVQLTSASGIPIRLRPQEKFAIEYVLLTGEHLAYQEMTKALTNSAAEVTEEAERLWALVVAGAFSRTHLLQQSSMVLTAYTEHVVLHQHHNPVSAVTNNTTEITRNTTNSDSSNNSDDKNKDNSAYITVPPHAQLIDVPSSRWQQTSISPRSATNKESEENYRNGNNGNNNNNVSSMSRASVRTVYSPNTISERQNMISNGSSHTVNNNNNNNNTDNNNNNTNKDSTISAVFAVSPTRRTNEELKALKEEIRNMRSEQTPSPGSGTPYYNNNSSGNINNNYYGNGSNGVRYNNDRRNSNKMNNTAQLSSSSSSHKPPPESHSDRQKYDPTYATSSGNELRSTPLPRTSASNASGSSTNTPQNLERKNSTLSSKSDSKAARKKEADKKAAMLLMQIPSTTRPPRQGNGVKLYILLIMMFVAYCFILYLRRPTKQYIGHFAAPSVMASYHTFATNYSNDNSGRLVQNHNMLNATDIRISR